MIPKTEKELELYFLLQHLDDARNRMNKSYAYFSENFKEIARKDFEELKIKYLKLANEL